MLDGRALTTRFAIDSRRKRRKKPIKIFDLKREKKTSADDGEDVFIYRKGNHVEGLNKHANRVEKA